MKQHSPSWRGSCARTSFVAPCTAEGPTSSRRRSGPAELRTGSRSLSPANRGQVAASLDGWFPIITSWQVLRLILSGNDRDMRNNRCESAIHTGVNETCSAWLHACLRS